MLGQERVQSPNASGMHDARLPQEHSEGVARWLHHLGSVGRLLSSTTPPPLNLGRSARHACLQSGSDAAFLANATFMMLGTTNSNHVL